MMGLQMRGSSVRRLRVIGLACGTLALLYFWTMDQKIFFSNSKTLKNRHEVLSSKNIPGQTGHHTAFLQQTVKSPTKILIHAYMRGGSTFLSEVFNKNSEAILWYEPLAPVYGLLYGLPMPRMNSLITPVSDLPVKKRIIEPWEEKQIVDYFKNLFECRLFKLPRGSVTDMFMRSTYKLRKYVSCYKQAVENITGSRQGLWNANCIENSLVGEFCTGKNFDKNLQYAKKQGCHVYLQRLAQLADSTPNVTLEEVRKYFGADKTNKTLKYFHDNEICMQNLYNAAKRCLQATQAEECCIETSIRAAKVIRLKMYDIAPVMEAIPDLFTLYYYRDPRAIAKSRIDVSSRDYGDSIWIQAVNNICIAMEQDISATVSLETKFPGRLLFLKYEDIIKDAKTALGKLHQQMGHKLTSKVLYHINGIMHATKDGGKFQVQRRNASSLINSWRQTFSEVAMQKVNALKSCQFVFQYFGYSMK
ncbi:hypothetical protein CAPTEDRAFT_186382 [Capitella teleta]|uniref:Uncharacterized protein n=1 Tax=Capitella teleta TaxID=283909 RepID=R7U5J4_CAPTE|nr:hypothetical protein CAPTEDRAFT_186382 [Capitella teleta]|eukprot:ELT98961.1 hypothetical protein CAPTEDRAFT_186382 [Capitella teleta]